MNHSNNNNSISSGFVNRVAPMVSPATLQLLLLGQQRGWDFAVLGQAPLPEDPVRLGDWLIVPADQDTSQVPARALERVQAIYAAGIRPKGFVVVHEAPKLLSAPVQDEPNTLRMPILPAQLKTTLTVVAGALGVLAIGFVVLSTIAVLAVLAISVAAMLILPAALVVGVALVDPILIAVTEDGYWVELDRWTI